MLLFCRLVLKSIGYKSVAVDGLPFDHHKGTKMEYLQNHCGCSLLFIALEASFSVFGV